jgi:hypothetical protein
MINTNSIVTKQKKTNISNISLKSNLIILDSPSVSESQADLPKDYSTQNHRLHPTLAQNDRQQSTLAHDFRQQHTQEQDRQQSTLAQDYSQQPTEEQDRQQSTLAQDFRQQSTLAQDYSQQPTQEHEEPNPIMVQDYTQPIVEQEPGEKPLPSPNHKDYYTNIMLGSNVSNPFIRSNVDAPVDQYRYNVTLPVHHQITEADNLNQSPMYSGDIKFI